MNLTRKTVYLHGNREVHVLTPKTLLPSITVTDDYKGICFILSNGTGYAFLRDVFALAIALEDNELIYIPLQFLYMDAYNTDFPWPENHCSGIVAFNYCSTRLNSKDIAWIVKQRRVKSETINRYVSMPKRWPDRWKTHRRLTVKRVGKLLTICGNGDTFASLADSCSNLAQCGDDVEYNNCPPHMHHDWSDENTSKSTGVTLFYWHHGV